MSTRSRAWWWLIGVLALPRCNCEDALTAIEAPDASAFADDAEPIILLDAGGGAIDAQAIDAQAIDAETADASVAEATDAGTVAELCDTRAHATLERTFAFGDFGPCPWGQGDNSALGATQGWSARTEQIETITDLPSEAVVCAARFAIPQTAMYFDDAMVIALAGVILMTDVNIAVFPNDGTFYLYDWPSLHGTGGSNLYCLESCALPPQETPGPMSLEISATTAQTIGARGAAQGAYELRVVTIGDNDANDCRHAAFDFTIALEYVVP